MTDSHDRARLLGDIEDVLVALESSPEFARSMEHLTWEPPPEQFRLWAVSVNVGYRDGVQAGYDRGYRHGRVDAAAEAEDEIRQLELRCMPYREYLQTPEWEELRDAVRARDGEACRVCNATERLDVHHRTYERRGREDLDDLTTLCRACHDAFHQVRSLSRPASS